MQRPQKVKKAWESPSASRFFLDYIMIVVIILWLCLQIPSESDGAFGNTQEERCWILCWTKVWTY